MIDTLPVYGTLKTRVCPYIKACPAELVALDIQYKYDVSFTQRHFAECQNFL